MLCQHWGTRVAIHHLVLLFLLHLFYLSLCSFAPSLSLSFVCSLIVFVWDSCMQLYCMLLLLISIYILFSPSVFFHFFILYSFYLSSTLSLLSPYCLSLLVFLPSHPFSSPIFHSLTHENLSKQHYFFLPSPSPLPLSSTTAMPSTCSGGLWLASAGLWRLWRTGVVWGVVRRGEGRTRVFHCNPLRGGVCIKRSWPCVTSALLLGWSLVGCGCGVASWWGGGRLVWCGVVLGLVEWCWCQMVLIGVSVVGILEL